MRGFLKEFREFAMRGNVIDLAVGVVIGTAFNRIVSSLVADIITPLLSFGTGSVTFKDLKVVLREGSEGVSAVTLNYGLFLQSLFDFILIALSIFVAIKFVNTLRRQFERKKEEQPKAQERSYQEKLLEEIRDLLRKG